MTPFALFVGGVAVELVSVYLQVRNRRPVVADVLTVVGAFAIVLGLIWGYSA